MTKQKLSPVKYETAFVPQNKFPTKKKQKKTSIF